MKNYMQGDITLIACEAPKGKLKTIKHKGEYILALGEKSGHDHIVRVAEPNQMIVMKDKDGNIYLQLLDEGTLTHEMAGSRQKADHGTHILTPHWYKFTKEREYDYFQNESRQVID